MSIAERLDRGWRSLRTARRTAWPDFRRDPNVLGMAIGQRIVGGEVTGVPALVVYVARKLPAWLLPSARELPRRIPADGGWVEVDVVETGSISTLAFTARERPAPSGISIGHSASTGGTLGCLVVDETDGSLCILSNNHVLANENAAAIGDAILQPGSLDGGRSPADDIARLKRFAPLAADGNIVDAAIAQAIDSAMFANRMKNDSMPIPGPNHPAVGLLFAGSSARSFMNPFDQVFARLGVRFPVGPGGTVPADIGMDVEKTGRTTEHTMATVTEIDATIKVAYAFGVATFDEQIATAVMAEPGDSGAVVCRRASTS